MFSGGPIRRLWRRCGLTWLVRLWSGADIFISYSHVDGSDYALALAAQLTAKGFRCYLDQWTGIVDDRIPSEVRTALIRSSALVVVLTPAALFSRPIEREFRTFRVTRRPIHSVVPGLAPLGPRWEKQLRGLSKALEEHSAFERAAPSKMIVDRIVHAKEFVSRNRTLQRIAVGTAIVTAGLVTWSTVAANRAELRATNAEDRRKLAADEAKAAAATANSATARALEVEQQIHQSYTRLFELWGLPQYVFQKRASFEHLALSPILSSLGWLADVPLRSLSVSLSARDLRELKNLPASVEELTIRGIPDVYDFELRGDMFPANARIRRIKLAAPPMSYQTQYDTLTLAKFATMDSLEELHIENGTGRIKGLESILQAHRLRSLGVFCAEEDCRELTPAVRARVTSLEAYTLRRPAQFRALRELHLSKIESYALLEPFHALRALSVGDPRPHIRELTARPILARRLEALTISSVHADELDHLPALPHLRVLGVTLAESETDLNKVLEAITAAAPGLEELRIAGGRFHVPRVPLALDRLPHLRKAALYLFFDDWHASRNPFSKATIAAPQKVRLASVGQSLPALQSLVISEDFLSLLRLSDLSSVQRILIPRSSIQPEELVKLAVLPNLKSLGFEGGRGADFTSALGRFRLNELFMTLETARLITELPSSIQRLTIVDEHVEADAWQP